MNFNEEKLFITLTKLTLITLVSVTNGRAGAKIIISLAKDYIRKNKQVKAPNIINEKAFRSALNSLGKSGLAERSGWGIWNITKKGRRFINRYLSKIDRYTTYKNQILENKNKDIKTVIIFDIPEKERYKRDVLRMELVALGFKQTQKSVWTGCTSLPKLFLEYLRDQNLLSYVRIFSVKESGTL